MTKLTKIEKETIILFNEAEDMASIYTYNASLKKRLEAFSRKYPNLCDWKSRSVRAVFSICSTSPDCPSACNPHTVRNAGKKPATTPDKMVSTVRRSDVAFKVNLRSEYWVCT